jgi:hypothetical protein
MDHHVRAVVTKGLRRRGVDVLTAAEDHSNRLADPDLLTRATQLDRILFTQDEDLLAIASARMEAQHEFAGVIYVEQGRLSDRDIIESLAMIAGASDARESINRVVYLPI